MKAQVQLGRLSPDDVQVQLFHGLVDNLGESRSRTRWRCAASNGDGAWVFTGTIPCRSSGQHGYAVRVLPRHADWQPVRAGAGVLGVMGGTAFSRDPKGSAWPGASAC